MDRLIFHDLVEWSKSLDRTPLLLRGARQVGKTHAVRQLAKTFSSYVEINFEKQPYLTKIFEFDLDPVRIVREIEISLGKTIKANKTLLFIDEIQQEPRAIIALRYFYEEIPDLHVIAAGSLVDFAIEEVGVPVGRISFLYMYPMSFIEYLCAINMHNLAFEIVAHKPGTILSEAIHIKAIRHLAEYMALGGMPKVIHEWITKKDIKSAQAALARIKLSYEQDFSKYAKRNQIKYVDLLFKKIPSIICNHFKYTLISTDYRKRELEPALLLLERAGVVHQITHSSGNGIPLGAEIDFDKFKLIMLDVGLNQNMLGLDLSDWFVDPINAFINKGNIAESFIGQELLAYSNNEDKQQLYYWQREKKQSHAEVDYLMDSERQVIPIEVKSNHGGSFKSMRIFLQLHPQSPYGIRFSIHNYSIYDGIHSFPLYAVAGIINDKSKLLKLIQLNN